MWLRRVSDCYHQGAHGIYVYQCDAPVLSSTASRSWVRLAAYPEAVAAWLEAEEERQSEYSRDVYLQRPLRDGAYQPYQRLRVWIEGAQRPTAKLFVDGDLVNEYDAPPYVLGSEDISDDHRFTPGPHTLLVEVTADSGERWEREFELVFA
jgi:hypothetical protein